MTRIVNFSDGFTSASAPSIEGASQVDYTITNNQSVATTLFTIDAATHKGAFVSFELSRVNASFEYRQVGTFLLSYTGSAWVLNVGNYQGDDLIQSAISLTNEITLTVTTSTGVGSIKYTSGNMSATSYVGSLKVITTKVSSV